MSHKVSSEKNYSIVRLNPKTKLFEYLNFYFYFYLTVIVSEYKFYKQIKNEQVK